MFDHHDRIVNHKPVEIVNAISDKLFRLYPSRYHTERPDDRQRYRNQAPSPQRSQEQEDHHHNQPDCQDQ
jgi:hypothetical protein